MKTYISCYKNVFVFAYIMFSFLLETDYFHHTEEEIAQKH